ncbi:MAG: ABC transporter substrate-binding protein [Chloroflexales bacterium]|nr:ABC transporter substrate-binding protein [Chloroflexales bacterium]
MRDAVVRVVALFATLTLLLTACGQAAPSTGGSQAASPTTAEAAGTTTAPTTAEAAGTTAPTTAEAAGTTTAPTTAEAAGTTPTAEPILIGVAVSQTSNVALLGQDQADAAKIAEEYFNAQGGVNGRPIKLVIQDGAGDEQGAINAFNTLINTSKVVGIIGPTLSQQAFAADKIADQAGVPVLAPSNTAKGIPEIGAYVTRVSAPVAKVAPNAVEAALKINPNIKKVAVGYAQDDAFSKSETGTFQQVVTDTFKLDLATVQTWSTKDTDFTTQATAILNEQPDLVIISGLAADGGNLVRQLRELGYTGLIVGGNGFNTSRIYSVCKESCDGVLVAQAYSPALDTPINKAWREQYMSQKNMEPGQIPAQTFACVQIMVEALAAMDKQTPLAEMDLAALRTELNSQIQGGTYQTPLGEISFTKVENGGAEVNQKQFYVAQIKMNPDGTSGTFEFVQ